MKKLTYVTPEIKYAIVDEDILTNGSFDAGADLGDENDGLEVEIPGNNQ